MKANCSCTLVKSKGQNIIVDTMTPWDKEKIVQALKNDHDLVPDDIHFVVCTHGHSDHIGSNHLFLRAKHIVGLHSNQADEYDLAAFDDGQPLDITEDVQAIPTPGHTLDSVSLIVKTGAENQGVVVIAGDIFEKEEDLKDDSIWREAGSDAPEKQIESREKILKMADYIVPGHGPMFKVPKA